MKYLFKSVSKSIFFSNVFIAGIIKSVKMGAGSFFTGELLQIGADFLQNGAALVVPNRGNGCYKLRRPLL